MEKEREEMLNAAEEAADTANKAAEAADEAAKEAEVAEAAEDEPDDGEITLVGWLWRMCIPLIPCAGIIIYIVLLCMWAFGGKQTESMRIWAKAALIATLIKIAVVGIILLVLQLNLHLFDPITAIIKRIF